MAFILKDRIRETSTTTGTGDFTLAGAVSGLRSFSSVCSIGDTFWYAIVVAGGDWETGIGTYSGTNTLTRTTVIESTNSNAAVSFSAGTKDVFIDLPASRALSIDGASAFTNTQKGQARDNIAAAWNGSFNAAARFGGFSVWQRGASLAVAASTSSAYQNDGWYILTNTGQAATVARVAGIASGSQYAAKVQRNSGQTGTSIMRYMAPLDSDEILPMQGQYVAFSFTAVGGANWSPSSGTLNYLILCGTGSPAKRQTTPYTGETNVFSGSVNLTTTAARVTVTSGAVWPTNGTQAEIHFYWTPTGTAGADDSFTIGALKLETVASGSSTATPYTHTLYQKQIALAQRWLPSFTSTGTQVGVGFGQAFNTTSMFAAIPLPVFTRATITGITYSAVGHFGVTNTGGTPVACTALTFLNAQSNAATLRCDVASGMTVGAASGLFFTSASGLLLFTGAEI